MRLKYKKFHQMNERELRSVSFTHQQLVEFENERSRISSIHGSQSGQTESEIINRMYEYK